MPFKQKSFFSITLKCIVLLALWLLLFCFGWSLKLEASLSGLITKSTNFKVDIRPVGGGRRHDRGPVVREFAGETFIKCRLVSRREIGKQAVLLKRIESASSSKSPIGSSYRPVAIVEIVQASFVSYLRVIRKFADEELDLDDRDQFQLWY